MLESEFELVNLTPHSLPLVDVSKSPYLKWLGCDQQQDAQDCIQACRRLALVRIDFVVVDHYALDYQWEEQIRDHLSPSQMLAIDDLADRTHAVDLLLDSGRTNSWNDHSYDDLVAKNCLLLLGPCYSLLDSEYLQFRKLTTVRSRIDRVLVFFGGVDQDNWCSLALQALKYMNFSHLNVDVVLGGGAPHLSTIRGIIDSNPRWSLHVGIPCLARLASQADIAIGAGGVHSWERACLGLPAIVVAIAENQENLLNELDSLGVVKLIRQQHGKNAVAAFIDILSTLVQQPSLLTLMSETASQVVDGYGINRITSILLGTTAPFLLRPAQVLDLGLYFWWATDPSVRQASLQTSNFSILAHSQWFMSKLNSVNTLLRILIDDNGMPLGQIRFERASSSSSSAVISLSLDRHFRGQGLSPLLLSLGLDELTRCWGSGITVLAQVKADNEASEHLFTAAGFRELDASAQGVRCFVLSPKIS
tara:strand:+ start:9275 stop:10705 length:1431 start_codon:yes stop_codon:yes gene_type:complete